MKNLAPSSLSVVVLVVILSASPMRAETVSLKARATEQGVAAYSPETFTLVAGDVAQVLYGYGGTCVHGAISGTAFDLNPANVGGYTVSPVLAGPATIQARALGTVGTAAFITVAITRANAVAVVTPQNTVVIPENASGPVQIALESSVDLVNWTAANPGTYGVATARRLFRVRAVQQ